jgi:hypothetical protein
VGTVRYPEQVDGFEGDLEETPLDNDVVR